MNSTVKMTRSGLAVAGESVEIISASVRHFEVPPEQWRAALEATQRLGCRLVDTCLPWNLHERAPGEIDFGRQREGNDISRFMQLAAELGLYASIRIGPLLEEAPRHFGVPERLIWDPACQARSARGSPVVAAVLPQMFPLPSYASDSFLLEAERWLDRVTRHLAPQLAPTGPIVMLHITGLGPFTVSAGGFEQDYHPDAITRYRAFLKRKHGHLSRLRELYQDPEFRLDECSPPGSLPSSAGGEQQRALDWAEFQEQLCEQALARFGEIVRARVAGRAVVVCSVPAVLPRSPVDPARAVHTVDLVVGDFCHSPARQYFEGVVRDALELCARAEGLERPAVASLPAGFSLFDPPRSETDDINIALLALAHGLSGFNLNRAGGAPRWLGAPLSPSHDVQSPAASRPRDNPVWRVSDRWRSLVAAVQRVRLFELRREPAVYIVVPRALTRTLRVASTVTAPALSWLESSGLRRDCAAAEVSFADAASRAERFVDDVMAALDAHDVTYSVAPADLIDDCLNRARWVIVACAGQLDDELAESLVFGLKRGTSSVSVGPEWPSTSAALDEQRRSLESADSGVPLHLAADDKGPAGGTLVSRLSRLLARQGIRSSAAEPDGIRTRLFRDDAGRPRVLFVINASDGRAEARVEAHATQAIDALTLEPVHRFAECFELDVAPWSVRMLELRSES